MSKKIRILSLLLALMMIASTLVACGTTPEDGANTSGNTDNVTEEETNPPGGLPRRTAQ